MNNSFKLILKARSALIFLFAFFITILNPLPSFAAFNDDVCNDSEIVLGFFNGVMNTAADAELSLNDIKRTHGSQNSNGEKITYEILYNPSNGIEDFVETFEQRLNEQGDLLSGRFELFFESLDGGGTWWSKLINVTSTASSVLSALTDFFQASIIKNLTALAGNPPTITTYTEQSTRIENWLLEGKKLVFVAHSQGNLFANSAYDFAMTKTTNQSVKLVHVAPASPTLRGPHILANLDLVINGLRAFGSVPPVTDTIPPYSSRVPNHNGFRDILGHGFTQIYTNRGLTISSKVSSHITKALNSVISPSSQAVSGFFTATLVWDGPGDVDLHTFEPDGTHVFYANTAGNSGFLDVDNIIGFGPEHYYATCDSTKLQTGIYRLALANYRGAKGRLATLQLSTSRDGPLSTKSFIMGDETRDDPSVNVFNVLVSKDPETDTYKATLQ